MCNKEAYWRFEYRPELVSAGDTRARQLPPGWLQTEQEPFIFSNLFPRMYRHCIYHLNQAIDSGYASDLAENSFNATVTGSAGAPPGQISSDSVCPCAFLPRWPATSRFKKQRCAGLSIVTQLFCIFLSIHSHIMIW